MAVEIFKLVGSIFVDNEKANESISKTDQKAEGLSGKFLKGVGTAAKWGAGIVAAAGAGATALYGMATKSAEATDRIDKMSQKVGLSRQAFQEMDFACSQSGMSVESLQGGMKTLTAQIDKGADGFSKLGVSLKNADGSLRSQEDVMFDTMSALQGMENQTEKARLASELFGKSGTELMPMLNGAAGSIDEMRKKAHELGLVMGDDAIDSGVAFTDMVDQIKRSFGAVTTQVGVEVMPILMELGQFILDNMPTIQEVVSTTFTVIQEVVGFAGELIGGLIDVIKALVESAQTEGTFFNAVWENIKIVVDTTLKGIQTLFGAFTALFKGDFEGFLNGINDFLNIAIEGLVKLIANSGKFFLDAGKSIFLSLWDGIKSVWDDIKNWVEEKVSWLTDKVTFWKKKKSEMSEDNDTDGSHAGGLERVPFDGYRAVLHKEEMVLTAEQGKKYRNGETKGEGDFVINIGTIVNKSEGTMTSIFREGEFYRKQRSLATGGV